MGIGWPGVIGLMRNESVPWEVMPEVFKCSVREMRRHLRNLEGFHIFPKVIAEEKLGHFCGPPCRIYSFVTE